MSGPGERQLTLTLAITGAAALGALALGLDRVDGEHLRGIVTGLALLGATLAALLRIERSTGEGLLRIHLAGLGLKLAGMALRIHLLFVVYGGSGDARRYVTHGARFMEHFRAGEFVTTVGMAGSEGTENISLLVGILFTATGKTFLGASITFTLISYWGQFLFTRALRRAVPEADHRRYTLLVFLFPTLWYWPSIVGKDALMIGGLGLAAHGAAGLLGRRAQLRGLGPFLAGCLVLGLIRPHLALISVVALTVAAAFGTATRLRSLEDIRTSGVRMIALIILALTAAYVATQVSSIISSGESDRSFTDILETAEARTATGGSEFRSHPLRRPTDLPRSSFSVLIRPAPWEAENPQMLLASFEGIAIAALIVASRRRLLTLARNLHRRPYLVFTLAYTLVFIGAFSYISNFGILVRQRSQLLPLFLTLLALHPTPRRRTRSPARTGLTIPETLPAGAGGTPRHEVRHTPARPIPSTGRRHGADPPARTRGP